MKPYYERDGITIYHGDCREILPSIKADVVVTDPPYGLSKGIAHVGQRGKGTRSIDFFENDSLEEGLMVTGLNYQILRRQPHRL